MATPFVTGPANIFTSTSYTGSNYTWEFLGHTERGVSVFLPGNYDEVICDATGTMVPLDFQYMGEYAYISIEPLIRWNAAVLHRVQARIQGVNAGTIAANSIGTIMALEGYTYGLVIQCPYSSKAAYNTQEAGWYFPNAFNFGDQMFPFSTRARRPTLMLRAQPTPGLLEVGNSSTLYSFTLPGNLPAVN